MRIPGKCASGLPAVMVSELSHSDQPHPLLLTDTTTALCSHSPTFLTEQTKIFEVLQLKKEEGRKLWVSDECTVLDAVKKVGSC